VFIEMCLDLNDQLPWLVPLDNKRFLKLRKSRIIKRNVNYCAADAANLTSNAHREPPLADKQSLRKQGRYSWYT